jgi:hypothetical protein
MSSNKDTKEIEVTIYDYKVNTTLNKRSEEFSVPKITYKPSNITLPAFPLGFIAYSLHYLKFQSPKSKYIGALTACGALSFNHFLSHFMQVNKVIFDIKEK